MRCCGAIAVLLCLVSCNSSSVSSSDTSSPSPEPSAEDKTIRAVSEKRSTPLASGPERAEPASGPAKKNVRSAPLPVKRSDIVAVTLLSPRSLSMKLRLKGGEFKVFKPMLRKDRRARYEVAAYRMARLLDMTGVPPAAMGRLPIEFLVSRLSKDAKESADALAEAALLTDNQHVTGAEIEWVSDLDPAGIEQVGGISVMKQWLRPGRPKANLEPVLARQFSRMVCFDYLIGNWDRFSGGNLFINRAADDLVLIDHNGTFADMGETREKRMRRLLESTERFSRSFVEKSRRMTASDIQNALSEEPTHSKKRILSKHEIALILGRRDALLGHIDALISHKGFENIMVFE